MTDRPPADRLFLVGMMGAGKSTVGRLLANRLGWASVDSDEQVEQMTGHSVAELFASDGEARFRSLESEVLARVVEGPRPVVVSVGGGAVLAAANRRRMRGAGKVVWLRAEVETLVARVGDGGGRPLLPRDTQGVLARLSDERRTLYEEVADVVIDVDGLDPHEVAELVLAGLMVDGLVVDAAGREGNKAEPAMGPAPVPPTSSSQVRGAR